MEKNTYKSQKRRGLFTYLERTTRLERFSLHGLSGRHLLQLFFIFSLGILYVGNTHYHEKMVRQINELEREVGALRVDYTILQAGYMFDSKQSEVAKRVAKLGLSDATHPPYKINCKK